MFRLAVPVALGARPRARELVQRLIRMFHVPVYLEDGQDPRTLVYRAADTHCTRSHDARNESIVTAALIIY